MQAVFDSLTAFLFGDKPNPFAVFVKQKRDFEIEKNLTFDVRRGILIAKRSDLRDSGRRRVDEDRTEYLGCVSFESGVFRI